MLKSKTSGPKKTFTITEGTPSQDTIETATLGTSEPATGTGFVSYTFAIGHLPTVSPAPVSIKYVPVVYVWGYNGSGSDKILTYRGYKGETEKITQATYTAITTANYWTLEATFEPVSSVGDTFTLAVWDTTGSLDIRGSAFAVYPTQIQFERSKGLYNVAFLNVVQSSQLTIGVPGANNDSYNIFSGINLGSSAVATSPKMLYSDPYTFSHYFHEGTTYQNKGVGKKSTTVYPLYQAPKYPRSISYVPVSFEGKL